MDTPKRVVLYADLSKLNASGNITAQGPVVPNTTTGTVTTPYNGSSLPTYQVSSTLIPLSVAVQYASSTILPSGSPTINIGLSGNGSYDLCKDVTPTLLSEYFMSTLLYHQQPNVGAGKAFWVPPASTNMRVTISETSGSGSFSSGAIFITLNYVTRT